MTDQDKGLFALRCFHDEAIKINPNLPKDFDAFLDLLRRAYYPVSWDVVFPGYRKSLVYTKSSHQNILIFADGLGFALNTEKFSDNKIRAAMKALAVNGKGNIPTSEMDFFEAVKNEAQKFDFFDAASYVIRETSKEIVTGVSSVGNFFLKYKSMLILGVLGIVGAGLYMRIKGSRGFGFKANPVKKQKKLNKPIKKQKKWNKPSKVQALVFSRSEFPDLKEARAWITKANKKRKRKFKMSSIALTPTQFRFRQLPPKAFLLLRSKIIAKGVSIIFGPIKST